MYDGFALETATYRKLEPSLLASQLAGKWIVIYDDELIGVYDTNAEAFAAGQARLGRSPFLIRPIGEYERAELLEGVGDADRNVSIV